MTRVFCAALMLLGLGGCGGAGDSTVVPTPVVSNRTAVPTPVVSNRTTVPTLVVSSDTTDPTPVVGNDTSVPTGVVSSGSCGEIVLSGNPARPVNEDVLRRAGNCLAQALQTCSETMLTVRDTTNNLTRQFSVLRNGTDCTLRQALHTSPDSPPAVADCQRVRAYTTALVVEGCSHLGDFTLTP